MSRIVIIAAILASEILGGCHSNTPLEDAVQEIIDLERSALDKWAQSNTDGYIAISADEITWFDFTPGDQQRVNGLQEVRNFLAPISEIIPPHTYDLVDPQVQAYGNTAVLTFHWMASLADGTPITGWKATSVYNRKDGKWRQVHAHWSLVLSE